MSTAGTLNDTPELDGEYDGPEGPDGADGLAGVVEMVLRGLQNAFIYGYRVRFLHSLAYQLATAKPQKGLLELLGKVWKSVRMGVDHGKVLAIFATVYRCVLVLAKRVRASKQGQSQLSNHFAAGFVGGVLVYSGLLQRAVRRQRTKEDTPTLVGTLLALNEGILSQITMYTMSRLIIAGGRDLARVVVDTKRRYSSGSKSRFRERDIATVASTSWVVTCGLVWGGIMVYYQRDRRLGRDQGSGSDKRLLYLPRALQMSLEFIYGGAHHAWREAFDYNSR